MLGIRYREVSSFPVGYVDRLTLHSLDFEEFLWATGMTEQNIAYLHEHFDSLTPVPAAVHNRMMKLFLDYVVVGGMPAVVARSLESHSYAEVLRVQREIVEDYKDDIAKYAEGNDKAKARACFLSIPRQLARNYKKFSYAVVDQGRMVVPVNMGAACNGCMMLGPSCFVTTSSDRNVPLRAMSA